MFRNYLRIALRNIARNRISSFINVAGLAIGIASCLLIFLYVQNELSYDRHFKNHDRIFRITTLINLQSQTDHFALSAPGLAPALKEDYPEIEQAVRMMPVGKQAIWHDDKMYKEEVSFLDSNFFKVFDLDFIKGNPNNALVQPKTIVISDDLAKKFFGSTDVLGKQIKFTKNWFSVTGVFRANAFPTHLKGNEAFLSMSTLDSSFRRQQQAGWFNMGYYTYVMLKDRTMNQAFIDKLPLFYKNRIEPWIKQNKLNSSMKFIAQPIEKIHFSADLLYDVAGKGNISYVYIFSYVSLFILLIDWINYMNLATAKAVRRSKEVGIRKVLGAARPQLILQFLGESILITLFALVIALILVEIMLPVFNDLAETSFSMSFLGSFKVVVFLLLVLLAVGLIGGSYPAFFLSSFNPADVLKSQKIPGGFNSVLRKSLVIIQFSISTVLMIGTMVVYSQMHYMKNKDLGFNKERVYVADLTMADTALGRRLPALKDELLRNPDITQVSMSDHIPGEMFGRLLFFSERNGKQEENAMSIMFCSPDFLKMLGVPLLKGRFFSKDYAGDDTAAFIVNESAVQFMGWKDPIGQHLANGAGFNGKVVGVVKNFNYTSLHNPIEPLIMMMSFRRSNFLLARLAPGKTEAGMDFVRSKVKSFDANHPIDFFFLDQQFDKQYIKEEKMLTIFGYFAALTILIACLGLFGLSAHTAEQKTKEIGIRKVNGATERDIVMLFVKEFMKLVALSLIIAWPISWYLMQRWLQDFAYRTSLSPLVFVLAGVIASLIALATIIYQAINSAWTNPVKALRYE
jgi:putative ABC transport system permease protein